MKNKVLFLCLAFIYVLCGAGQCSQSEGEAPCIFYLKGTCSAGKSTFIRYFSSKYTDVAVVDEDPIMQKSYVDAIKVRFEQEFAKCARAIEQENLFHAFREKDVLFKRTASSQERLEAESALQTIQQELNQKHNLSWKQAVSRGIDDTVISKIREALAHGKSVILDSWYIKPKHLNELFPKSKVICVMLYCPLQVAYERFLKRNKDAHTQENLQEKRYLRHLIGTFFSLYEITANPGQSIQQVTKHELNTVLDALAVMLKEPLVGYEKSVFTYDEMPLSSFLKMKADFLRPFEGAESPVLYIAPKERQYIVIDTSKDDLQKPTEQLLDLKTFCNTTIGLSKNAQMW